MNIDDFIALLTKRYGELKNEYQINDIKNYYRDRRVDFDKLYDRMAMEYGHEYFPSLPAIRKFTENMSDHKHSSADKVQAWLDIQRRVIDESKSFSVEKILGTIKAIRYDHTIRELKPTEISFCHFWSSLENFAGKLIDAGKGMSEISILCGELKSRIAGGNDETFYSPEDELEGQRTCSKYDDPVLARQAF